MSIRQAPQHVLDSIVHPYVKQASGFKKGLGVIASLTIIILPVVQPLIPDDNIKYTVGAIGAFATILANWSQNYVSPAAHGGGGRHERFLRDIEALDGENIGLHLRNSI